MSTSLINGSLSTGYCPTCGEDVDIQDTGKCPRGHLAMVSLTQKGLDKNIFKPVDTRSWNELSDSEKSSVSRAVVATGLTREQVMGDESKLKEVVILPPSRIARQWIQQTQTLIESLRATKMKLEAGIKMERKNIARIDKAIMTLSTHLENYTVADAPVVPAPPQWAMKYERCVVCGTTERKHKAKGLCVRCEGASRRVIK